MIAVDSSGRASNYGQRVASTCWHGTEVPAKLKALRLRRSNTGGIARAIRRCPAGDLRSAACESGRSPVFVSVHRMRSRLFPLDPVSAAADFIVGAAAPPAEYGADAADRINRRPPRCRSDGKTALGSGGAGLLSARQLLERCCKAAEQPASVVIRLLPNTPVSVISVCAHQRRCSRIQISSVNLSMELSDCVTSSNAS